jgi:hypothetical protein
VTAPISVSGGAGSIAADCQDMLTTASLLGGAAAELELQALALQAQLVDGLGLSAVIDPDGAVRVELELAAALDGPNGLMALALRCGVIQVALAAAARSYLAADQLRTDLIPLAQIMRESNGATVDALAGDWGAAWDQYSDNPYLADLIVSDLGMLVPLPIAGLFYWDGHPVVTAKGVDRSPAAAHPPRSLRDLIAGLAHRNDGAAGEIGVQILTGTDAQGQPFRKVVVDIPGTKDWNLWDPIDPNVTNFGTNVQALAGERTTYENGVIAAMKAAGVQPGDDVTLIGHSQGGVIAVNTARDLAAEGHNVTHVITAGAPISQVVNELPPSVQVMALENKADAVPHLDGRPNPDLGNVTTVQINHDHGSIGANHDLDESYVPGAADVDASNDASVRAYLDSLQQQLDATSSITYSYEITRGF